MLARFYVLADDPASLVPFKAAAVSGAHVPMKGHISCGRGQRKPAEKRIYSIDDELDDELTDIKAGKKYVMDMPSAADSKSEGL